MPQLVVNMNVNIQNKHYRKLKIIRFKMRTQHIQTVRHKQGERNRMINLLQESIKIPSRILHIYFFIFC